MKQIQINVVYIFTVSILVINCTHTEVKDQLIITEAQLIGDWTSSNTLINGNPIEDFMVYPYGISNYFGLKADGFYYFNYNSGDWKLENNTILLENERDLKILYFENGVLTLEAEIFESQTFVDLEGIESNEKITIQEDFRKE